MVNNRHWKDNLPRRAKFAEEDGVWKRVYFPRRETQGEVWHWGYQRMTTIEVDGKKREIPDCNCTARFAFWCTKCILWVESVDPLVLVNPRLESD